MPLTLDTLLEDRGISPAQLADASGVPLERIEAIVSGRWLASPDDRRKIAASLNVDVDQLVWGHTMDPRNVRYRQFGLREDFNA